MPQIRRHSISLLPVPPVPVWLIVGSYDDEAKHEEGVSEETTNVCRGGEFLGHRLRNACVPHFPIYMYRDRSTLYRIAPRARGQKWECPGYQGNMFRGCGIGIVKKREKSGWSHRRFEERTRREISLMHGSSQDE